MHVYLLFWENPVQRNNFNANDFNLHAIAPTYLIKHKNEELKILKFVQ